MSRVVFMCGPSGAGKTTYAARLEAAGMVRLSFDSHLWARGIRSGDVDPSVREDIRALLRDEWRALLAEHGVEPETVHLATDRGTVLPGSRRGRGRTPTTSRSTSRRLSGTSTASRHPLLRRDRCGSSWTPRSSW